MDSPADAPVPASGSSNPPGLSSKISRFRHFLPLRFLPALLILLASGLTGEEFNYSFKAGDSWRILSTVEQEVRVNSQFHHRARLLNRLLVQVREVKDQEAYHILEYQNSQEVVGAGQAFARDRDYHSEFWRDRRGSYRISPEYFVPTVLDVPWFPARNLEPGATWSHEGMEIHDLRDGLEIPEPLRFTMPVSYKYEGPVEEGGRTFHRFTVEYNVFYRMKGGQGGKVDVRRITGFSRQVHFWDPVHGRSDHYREEYSLALELSNNETWEYSGTAEAHVVDNRDWNEGQAMDEIRQDLDSLDLDNVKLRQTDEGISISLEDIRFTPDSSRMEPGEIDKLEKIAAILSRYPDRDILVTGHTALAGTPNGRMRLSIERARVVAQYLLDHGVRTQDQVMYEGKGATDPVADNASPEGMARNRRVEIILRRQ